MTSEQKRTPCERLGYTVGDVFEVVGRGDCFYSKGDKVVLEDDDGSGCPYFLSPKHSHKISCDLDHLKKIKNISNKYVRNIHGVEVDVYDVLKAWNVTCPAIQHAIKKLLMPGQRGHKSKANDLEEAHSAIQRAIELEVF